MHQNIIFSNGVLDPWLSGGVTEYVNLHLPLYVIKGGAHHLDMRTPTEVDKGTDVEFIRDAETAMLRTWIEEYNRGIKSYSKDPKVALY
jgi:hypothetical protein